MKSLLCTVCLLLLLSGCTVPAVNETWKGFRVTTDCPINVPRPKMPRPKQAEMHHWFEVHYHTTLL